MDNMCTIHDLNNRNTNGEAKVVRIPNMNILKFLYDSNSNQTRAYFHVAPRIGRLRWVSLMRQISKR